MPTYLAIGWDMYDPRLTLKGTVVSTDTLFVGACCYIDANGYINLTDDAGGFDRIHGCALTAANPGDEVTLITHGRLKVVDTNTIGALIYGQADSGGTVPNTNVSGQICGFAIEATLLFIHIDSASAT